MMKKLQLFPVLFTVILICHASATLMAQTQTDKSRLAGNWAGKLKIQTTELRLVMNISVNAGDSLIITLDSPDQGASNLPTSKTILNGDSLSVFLKSIGGKFIGKIDPDVKVINGFWKQGGMSLPLILTRQDSKITINRPQEPKPPFPYQSLEVKIPNVAAKIELAGTLTMPEGSGKFPAAILITGSGPQNRDEELMGHKPFLVIADFLTRQGFAVLRYDDRGVGQSTGDFKSATSFDFATDAYAAVQFLKTRPEIDSVKIGLIGHSEGGIIAPIVASQHPEVAFVVLLAGPGLTGEQILLLQEALIAKAEGSDDKSIRENDKLSRDIYAALKKNPDNDKAALKITKIITDFNKKHASDTSYRQLTDNEITAQVSSLTSPWFRCFLTCNPEAYLTRVKCPLLALNGSLDLQVPSKENLQAIEKALIFGGNSTYMIEELPGLNHLFQTATTGSPAEYAKIEETISPAALDLIGKWLQKNVLLKR